MKDAFTVWFFVSVGMLFDFNSLLESPWLVLATIVMVVKPLSEVEITIPPRYPLGMALSQNVESSFIVATMGSKYDPIPDQAFNALIATAIDSATFSPLLYGARPAV